MKKKDKQKTDLPQIPEKYFNGSKLDELENKLQENKAHNERLQKQVAELSTNLKQKDIDFINSTRIYEKLVDEKQRQNVFLEEAITKIRNESIAFETKIKEEYEEKFIESQTENKKTIKKLTDELDHANSQIIKIKAKRKALKEGNASLEQKCEELNKINVITIENYEKKIRVLQASSDAKLKEMQDKFDEFIKSNEELMETDIYTVYKEIKKKFEDKLHECLSYKDRNEKISDENKLFKLSLDNNDTVINECARVQINQRKINKHLKEQLDEKTREADELKEECSTEVQELNYKYQKIIQNKDEEIKSVRDFLKIKNKENEELRSLSQMILDQRSEIEQFFIESLEEVKIDVYNRKKEAERKGAYFPNLKKKYEEPVNMTSIKKVDIKDLDPENKEKVLRLLFSKINENYKPKTYKNFDSSEFK